MRFSASLALTLMVAVACLVASLRYLANAPRPRPNAEQEALYLPNVNAARAVAFGYKNVLSDLILFKTVSYFGAHLRSDRNYHWLYDMCTLITELDPRAEDIYRFGSTMLAWEIGAIEDSNKILSKAIVQFPDNWIFRYLRGFNYLYFMKDKQRSREDFIEAAKLPGVHPAIANLAAKTSEELDDPGVAEMTIRGLLAATNDPSVKEVLEKRLKELKETK